MSKIIFELKDAYYAYLGKYPALAGVDLAIERAKMTAVIGANGSGKSTLLHMLDGLVFPDKGQVTAFGTELSEKAFSDSGFNKEFRGKVGLVFQNPDVQLFCPTVREDIFFGPLQLGLDPEKTRELSEKLSTLLGISHLYDRAPHQLSIGEKRKVAIASILVMDPEVLILDEPTAGLDPQTTRKIIDLLISENAAGKTVITSTHDLHIVDEIADIVCVFGDNRKILIQAPPEEILRDEELLKRNNLVHIHKHKHKGAVHVHSHTHTHPEHHT